MYKTKVFNNTNALKMLTLRFNCCRVLGFNCCMSIQLLRDQFSVFRHFSFQNFIFLLDISQRDFNFQFSTFNIHTSKFRHFNFLIF
jgi:hypothetical protein